jgi:hypothetical protein
VGRLNRALDERIKRKSAFLLIVYAAARGKEICYSYICIGSVGFDRKERHGLPQFGQNWFKSQPLVSGHNEFRLEYKRKRQLCSNVGKNGRQSRINGPLFAVSH